MAYRMLADLIVLTHVGFILFAILGGLLVMRWRWALWVHLPALAWGAAVAFFGWLCPLTPLEKSLRRAAGESGYSGGFIDHFVFPVLYPEGLTRELQVAMAGALLLVNGAIYLVVWRRARRRVAAETSAHD